MVQLTNTIRNSRCCYSYPDVLGISLTVYTPVNIGELIFRKLDGRRTGVYGHVSVDRSIGDDIQCVVKEQGGKEGINERNKRL